MSTQDQGVGLLAVVFATVLFAISPALAESLNVDDVNAKGELAVGKGARIEGPLRVGGRVQVNQTGTGVGIFVGDRTPFGQALFKTDLTTSATHAWFGENGKRVFSVAGGGNGFFSGALDVGGEAHLIGGAAIDGITRMGTAKVADALSIGKPPPTTGPNMPIGGLDDSTLRVWGEAHLIGGAAIDGITRMGTAKVADALSIGKPPPTTGPNMPIGGLDDSTLRVWGNAHVFGNQSIAGSQSFGAEIRQMLNLWSTAYGIGVQDFALYQRTADSFFWYKGGSHDHTFGFAGRDPTGKDGTQLMGLGHDGDLHVSGRVVTPVLQITGGGDVAEPFKMSGEGIPKGAVVIIDEENAGQLKLSEGRYDKRVAGIVSGANGIHPGISLGQPGMSDGGQNVALSGRVYVLADASSSPIKPGDLLTTSDIPGHAMKVIDHGKAQGAVIGKAMSALTEGQGMVLVLVTLQ